MPKLQHLRLIILFTVLKEVLLIIKLLQLTLGTLVVLISEKLQQKLFHPIYQNCSQKIRFQQVATKCRLSKEIFFAKSEFIFKKYSTLLKKVNKRTLP